MRRFRTHLPAAIALLLIAAFIAIPLPTASAQDKPPAEKKKTVLPAGFGELTIKQTDSASYTFKLTDPKTGEDVLAKGSFAMTEKSLQFRMTEPGGRKTNIDATRTDDNGVIYRLETGGVSTDIHSKLPDFNADPSRPVQMPLPIIHQDQLKAYADAAAQSRGLKSLTSALSVAQSSAKLDRKSTMLARLVSLALGGRASATVTPMMADCGDWAGLNFRMCMIDYGDVWGCFWDSVLFLIACLL